MKFELMMMDARREGEMLQLIKLVCRKMSKGKTLEAITEELEGEPDEIRRICEAAKQYAPDYDCEKILEELL